MTQDQELADLSDEWPNWHVWRGRDGHGQPTGWHATLNASGHSVILAASGPEELRQRLRKAAATPTTVGQP